MKEKNSIKYSVWRILSRSGPELITYRKSGSIKIKKNRNRHNILSLGRIRIRNTVNYLIFKNALSKILIDKNDKQAFNSTVVLKHSFSQVG